MASSNYNAANNALSPERMDIDCPMDIESPMEAVTPAVKRRRGGGEYGERPVTPSYVVVPSPLVPFWPQPHSQPEERQPQPDQRQPQPEDRLPQPQPDHRPQPPPQPDQRRQPQPESRQPHPQPEEQPPQPEEHQPQPQPQPVLRPPQTEDRQPHPQPEEHQPQPAEHPTQPEEPPQPQPQPDELQLYVDPHKIVADLLNEFDDGQYRECYYSCIEVRRGAVDGTPHSQFLRAFANFMIARVYLSNPEVDDRLREPTGCRRKKLTPKKMMETVHDDVRRAANRIISYLATHHEMTPSLWRSLRDAMVPLVGNYGGIESFNRSLEIANWHAG